MLPPLFRVELIEEACQNDRLVLTSNQRLRRKVLQAWGVYQQQNKAKKWPSPRIFSLSQWFQYCWQQLQNQAYPPSQSVIVSEQQERILWEKVISTSDLLGTDSLASQAAEGLRRLDLWQIPLRELETYGDNHVSVSGWSGLSLYHQWCLSYRALLKQHQLISQEESYRIIGKAFDEGVLTVETEIELMGFDDVAPLIRSLLDKACHTMSETRFDQFEPRSVLRAAYETEEDELRAAAEWAKAQLEAQPNVRIALIVPNLGQCRDKVERALVNSFEGHRLFLSTEPYTYPFNISAGTPLIQSALMTDTLRLLRLFKPQWEVEDISQLLFSAYWGDLESEYPQRLALVTHLQSQGTFTVGLTTLRYWLEQDNESAGLSKGLQAIQHYQSNQHQPRLPSVWVDFFLSYLSLLRWPGSRQPNSLEYQQTQLWYQMLEEFTHLDDILGEINIYQALAQVEYLMSHTPFQPKVEDSPIQVLGILEGVGLHFSHCWVMGLHQQAWPPSPQPNTLLPISLQRKHQMPHSSSLRELDFARSLTKNYCHCAEHIIFSWPEYQTEKEQYLLASQLIQHIEKTEERLTTKPDFEYYLEALVNTPPVMDVVSCEKGPPVTKAELSQDNELLGGASVIKMQSENPFNAFAIYRLGAQAFPTPVIGFSSIEKGNILHQALASVWTQLKTQRALLAMDEKALSDLVHDSVSRSVNSVMKYKLEHIGFHLSEIEKERQALLLMQWLHFEKARPPFSVAAIEEVIHFHYREINLKLRVDRVDQLADGSYLIIDYKSGDSHTSAWQDERLREPQLPLYLLAYASAQALECHVNGIAFGQINVRQQSLVGLHDGEHSIQGLTSIDEHKLSLPKDWQMVKQYWQEALYRLLDGYLAGECPIDFRDSQALQNRAELWPLNRIHELYG